MFGVYVCLIREELVGSVSATVSVITHFSLGVNLSFIASDDHVAVYGGEILPVILQGSEERWKISGRDVVVLFPD